MLKRFTIIIFGFLAGVLGNLIAGYVLQDVWLNVFTPDRLFGTCMATLFMFILLVLLETEPTLPYAWHWRSKGMCKSAVEALGEMGDTRAVIPLIVELKNWWSDQIHWSASEALDKIGDFRAIPELIRLMREDRGKNHLGSSIADAARIAVKKIHQRMAIIQNNIIPKNVNE